MSSSLFPAARTVGAKELVEIITEVTDMTELALAPLGTPPPLDPEAVAKNSTQLSQLVLNVASRDVFRRRGVTALAVSDAVSRFTTGTHRDAECSRTIARMNQTARSVLSPAPVVELPLDLDEEEGVRIVAAVRAALAAAFPEDCADDAQRAEADAELHCAGFDDTMYPSVFRSLGYEFASRRVADVSLAGATRRTQGCNRAVAEALGERKLTQAQLHAICDLWAPEGPRWAQLREHDRGPGYASERGEAKFFSRLQLAQRGAMMARQAARQRRPDVAVQLYEEALTQCPPLHPQSAELLAGRAQVWLECGMAENAVEDCAAALALDGRSIEAFTTRCRALEQLGREEEALHDAVAVMLLAPGELSSQEPVERLSRVLARPRAHEMFEARTTHSSLPAPWLCHTYFSSFERCDAPLREAYAGANSIVVDLLRRAWEALAERDYAAAHGLVQQAASMPTRDQKLAAVARNQLASFQYLTGAHAEALESLGASLELDASLISSYVKQAHVWGEAGEVESALGALEAALLVSPGHPDVLHHRGQLLLVTGDPRAALDDLIACVKADGGVAMGHVALALAQYKSERKAEALETFDAALERFPDLVEARLFYAEVLTERTQLCRAMDLLRDAGRLAPDSPLPLVNAGRALMAADDRLAARQHFEAALEVDPACSAALLDLAQLLLGMGELDAAAARFENAKRCAPFLPELEDVCACDITTKLQAEVARELGVPALA